ncbi:glutamine--tRNA ligase/YqeY domain fusion protein [uncultured Desulfuromonas sp.]|uniref:glutamine--tRNA ligase/YqeY domain fusion protein n=1 Tax=uncultured Desulfuromonas sp. TaxID=181013 RepID=UPI002AAAC5FB|nr:glutamine--tRNA ligase/YqeY domain fusion protein [uncultured Desulfuromonas sp.]
MSTEVTETQPKDFIRNIIAEDLANNKHDGRLATRFPPEPNGYLHIGHAKSICLNFGVAEEMGGVCHLRFDDTNPIKEETEFIDAIKEDVQWLGFEWGEHEYYASNYFEQLYAFAVQLIKAGKAYVDDLTGEQMRELRGTLTEPGQNSPYRDRSVEENLDLFERMRNGEFQDGEKVLRAKIDMAAPNMNLRDPAMYRILKAHHHRTGDAWCIYPMYDFAHGQSDSIEKVTHSICTLEFADHRPLYDWFIEQLDIFAPRQYEFARLNLGYTVMSKRKLQQLVAEKHVSGWDDPRMPTLVGMRRRGFPAKAIRSFCERIGVGKSDSWIDMSVLEDCVREELNEEAPRAMCVLNPLKVVITDYPEGQEEIFSAPIHPQKPEMGQRQIPFSREVYIDHDDFMEDPPKKFFRLGPGREVRLRYGYVIKCEEVIYNDAGEVVELRCSHDAETLGKKPEGRKVKGIIHWVSAERALPVEVRQYDRLFNVESPGAGKDVDFRDEINPESINVLPSCYAEPGLALASSGEAYQFERLGYFCVDSRDSRSDALVFNRTVTLRDSWAKAK